MNKTIGYSESMPLIKAVSFPEGKIALELKDGRTVTVPVNKFPEIEKLTASQKRNHKTLAGLGLMFDDFDMLFHISDFIGKTFSVDDAPVDKKQIKRYTTRNNP